MMQFKVKVYTRHRLFPLATAIISNENDLQEMYDNLKNDSPVFNFGDIWVMKKVIKYVKIREK